MSASPKRNHPTEAKNETNMNFTNEELTAVHNKWNLMPEHPQAHLILELINDLRRERERVERLKADKG